MKIILFIVLSVGTFFISDNEKPVVETTNSTEYQWKKVIDAADFSKSYNFQLFSIDDKVWAFHPDGNWFSTDGKKWTKSPLNNAINNLAFLDYVQFENAILGLGYFKGNIEKYTLTTPIHKTTDFKTWQQVAQRSNLPKRFFYHPVVFKGKIWIVGGNDGQKTYADVWNSSDGISWQKVADNMPFGSSENRQFVVFKNKLYILGNDVWSSEDAVHWTQETKQITDAELFGYTALVFDNKIWLLGCNRNRQFTSQVLVSEDGKKWTGQNAPWSPRGGIAACVHNGKIYMTGGKYGGFTDKPEFVYSNDVWVLEKLNAQTAVKPLSNIRLIASTPGDALIKNLLDIQPDTKIDFIRWDLTLNTVSNESSDFQLNIIYGEGKPNTLGFIGGGEKRSIKGHYSISKSKNEELKGDVFELHNPNNSNPISFIKLNDNLFHLLTPDHKLMVGNGGWSYTLNRKQPLENISTALPNVTPSVSLLKTSRIIEIFDGRTPCQDLAGQYGWDVDVDCFKIKWKLTLNRDTTTLLPTTYNLRRVRYHANDTIGKWTIIKGYGQNPNAIVYQLDPDKPSQSLFFLVGDENVLFFLNKKQQLFVGDNNFSYTLNRKLTY